MSFPGELFLPLSYVLIIKLYTPVQSSIVTLKIGENRWKYFMKNHQFSSPGISSPYVLIQGTELILVILKRDFEFHAWGS